MNDQYNYNNYTPAPSSSNNGIATAALVCGIVSFLCSPGGLVSVAAIVLGIIGICQPGASKGKAITGLVLGAVSPIVNITLDLILWICTFGLSSFTFFL